MISLDVNGKVYAVEVAPEVPLLWVIREHLKLAGTKFGCGLGLCGACTIHIDGEAARSCRVPVSRATGKKITTIEGLPASHPLKQAWIAEEVPQCGYCQPGQIMQAAAFLARKPSPTEADIVAAMSGNLCRCGTYGRILRAVQKASVAGGRP